MSRIPSRDEALFSDALARPAHDRAAFLDSACGNDAALRARLDALLAANDGPESLMAAPALTRPAAMQDLSAVGPAKAEEKAGDRIGHYKLLQQIGEGGCGVVYMAEQEEPVRRRVALKVIKLGMDTKAVVARFEAERQALAMMDHANIAKVHDAGSTDAGRPFFVMELVRGIPITKYCDEGQLTPTARLELFIKVCQAIQHAHQKGIIHRDIKPSNILVTVNDGVPTPKVIDFGIAKATQGRLTDATVFTAFEQFIGTPVYMSPEQAEVSSVDIDTRSDIYSLGVLLYELLTGRPPFDPKAFAKFGVDQIRQQIREVEPARPSARLSTLDDDERTTIARLRGTAAANLSIILRGDLDWIVMRCLEKDRTRRYDTANGLAQDIQRYLRNEPVVARPPSTAYLLQKLVRRHRLAFAAGAVVACTLIAGFAISMRALIHEKAARQLAADGRMSAEKLLSFVFTDLAEQLDDLGQMALLEQLSERAVAYYETLPAALQTRETRASHAFALAGVGSLTESWSQRRDKARIERALSMLEELESTGPLTPFARLVFAASLCEMVHQYFTEGRYLATLPILERAERILQPALTDSEWRGLAHRLMSKILDRRADLVTRIGGFSTAVVPFPAAVSLFERAVASIEESERYPPTPRRPGLRAALIRRNIPEALYISGRRSEARVVAAEVQARLHEFIAREPLLVPARFMAAWATRSICIQLRDQWKFSEFVTTLEKQQTEWSELLKLDRSNVTFQGNLACSWASFYGANWFEHEWQEGKFSAAEAHLRRGVEALTGLTKYNLWHDTILSVHLNWARLCAALGRNEEADRQLAEAERLHRESLRTRLPAGADRDLHEISYERERCNVAFQRLDWPAMRRHAQRALERFAPLHNAGLDEARLGELELAARHDLVRASLEIGEFIEARSEVARGGFDAEKLPANPDIQQRFDFVGRQLTRIHVLARVGNLAAAQVALAKSWPEVDAVYAAKPDYLFNQIQTARALLIRAEVEGDVADRRQWLERAAGYLRPAAAAGRLTRYEREVLLAGIEKQLTQLANTDKP
ncbi:MAG: serine/threonine protein kinase [Opitutus sp.]|nr:serine/threonine protein kinase [Opitutus sp.]